MEFVQHWILSHRAHASCYKLQKNKQTIFSGPNKYWEIKIKKWVYMYNKLYSLIFIFHMRSLLKIFIGIFCDHLFFNIFENVMCVHFHPTFSPLKSCVSLLSLKFVTSSSLLLQYILISLFSVYVYYDWWFGIE